MAEDGEDPTERDADRPADRRYAAWHRDLARLRDVYLDAMACTDARAADRGFLRTRASLGAILRVLGALPSSSPASPMPGPDAGT